MSHVTRLALIIPVYNFAHGIAATLARLERWAQSMAAQGVVLQVLFVDDGSTDATAARIERPFGVVDDCFDSPLVAPGDHVDEFLRLRVLDVDLALSSDCSHWVLYDVPAHATCVEPQSGPPNQVNDDPRVVRPGESSSRWFRIGVERP